MRAQRANGLQKALFRRHNAHIATNGLNNHARNIVAMRGEQFLKRRGIVVARHHRVACRSCGNAWRIGNSAGSNATASTHQQAATVAMVVARKLHNFVALCKAARQANSTHRGFSSRRHHAHFLNTGHHVNNFLRQLQLGHAGSPKGNPLVKLLFYGRKHRVIASAENQRPPRANKIGVAVAIDIPHF